MRRWTFAAMSLGFCIGLTTVTRAQEVPVIPPAPASEDTLRDEALQLSQAPATGAPAPYETTPAPASPAPAASKPAAPKPPPQPWKPMFFDNDFSYKKTPHTELLGENLKDIPLDSILPWDIAEDTKISVGGEVRHRYMDERNRLRAPFGAGGHSTYDLLRWRNYVDLKHSDWVRVYVEMIDASIYNNDLPITGIDVNRWDLQNAFIDLKVLERDDKPVWFRIGRQELLFGSQRLISPLDWANTRRNFEGLRLNSPGVNWDLDAWLVNPVNTATFGAGGGAGPGLGVLKNDNQFDSPQRDILFGGGWATYKGIKDHTFDTFFLYDHHDKLFPGGNGLPAAGPLASNSFPLGDRYTLGTRWLGTMPVDGGQRAYLTDVEGAYQFGNNKGQSVQAGYIVTGGGHTWKTAPWEPTVWMFYDWASGDQNPTDNVSGTFFQHFGLVHAYMGLIDNVARQNISDINYRVQVKPTKKLQLQAAHHFFRLATANDSLYTVTGQRFGAAGGHGGDIGQELDLLATYTVNQNLSIEAGQFWFWYGDYIRNVQPTRDDAKQFYVQTTIRY
ncbi:MAG: alginate export family protein [Planctomycetales bacterium]|nr:alginate export family protein [Planctomycetales bacterium]